MADRGQAGALRAAAASLQTVTDAVALAATVAAFD